jgi:D-amino-acid dehydrogenase
MAAVTGRLIAEMVTGKAPFTDPAPYRVDRFS